MKYILALLVVLVLVGCSVFDRVEDPQREALKAALFQKEQQVAALETSVAAMKSAFIGSMTDAQKAEIEKLEAVIALVRVELPKLRQQIDDLPQGATYLELGATMALGYAAQFAPRLLAAVPGIGGPLSILAQTLANVNWKLAATPAQKREDEENTAIAAIHKPRA